MSHQYQAIGWNRQKRLYDTVIAVGVVVYIGTFVGVGAWSFPNATAETLLIRAFGTAAFLLLHVVLCIGPLCRLDSRFLPLLYNRRHLGVTTFLLGLAHGGFAIVQFHGFGNADPLVSLLTSNQRFGSLAEFPFQQLGFLALVILFLMAATSHDFWLKNLAPPIWKALHMLVYVAYGLLVAHVTLGALQSQKSPVPAAFLIAGLVTVLSLHMVAAWREWRVDHRALGAVSDGFVEACPVGTIPEKCATVVSLRGERIAIFRYDGKVSALSNVCRHQNGPLGEGRIIDGCVTCPWHGFQYLPETGASPPPFPEKVSTFATRIVNGSVWVNPVPNDPGTPVESSRISSAEVHSSKEFFVGYVPKTPPGIGRLVRWVVGGSLAGACLTALTLVSNQSGFPPAFFEFSRTQTWKGVLVEQPYPTLVTEQSRYLLVSLGKHGADEQVHAFAGKSVRLQGKLIHRDVGTKGGRVMNERTMNERTMIEVVPGSIIVDNPTNAAETPEVDLGPVTVAGEIVDSKCFLGVMNPGEGKVHRDCAARCISGGIPPAVLVRNSGGSSDLYLLADAAGRSMPPAAILDRVGEPVNISGRLVRVGESLILKADPANIVRAR